MQNDEELRPRQRRSAARACCGSQPAVAYGSRGQRLEEMDAEGAWSTILWGYADAMEGDGTVPGPVGEVPVDVDVRSFLGCR